MEIFLGGSWLQRKVQAESQKEQSRGQESTRSGCPSGQSSTILFLYFSFFKKLYYMHCKKHS